MKIVYQGISETGSRRAVNQDRIGMFAGEDAALFAVADGMGGHIAGEKASNEIIFGLKDWWHVHFCKERVRKEELEGTFQLDGTGTEKVETTSVIGQEDACEFEDYVKSLSGCLQQINQKIYQIYNGKEICGSTVIILFLYRGEYAILWAGDSRIYERTPFSFSQLSVDDTWSELAKRTKAFSKDAIHMHPDRDKLLNAVGTFSRLEVAVNTGILKKHEMFFLCSDGIYKSIPEKELKRQIKRLYNRRKKGLDLREIRKLVYEAGASDNLSAIAVSVECGGQRGQAFD
ncbi:MAG: serine/threonine-protein phosphatase [Lachnospiraceae bacterium]|nr:serine/threonine-protein phosphatase [Lachnospiraceae bacterium]